MQEFMGKAARDVVTGFQGIVTGHVQYITGCDQLMLTPICENKHKRAEESLWFDIARIEFYGDEPIKLMNVERADMTPVVVNGPGEEAPKK